MISAEAKSEPTQRWAPTPKARCGFDRGSFHTAGRHPAQQVIDEVGHALGMGPKLVALIRVLV
jgi:hypothetical protein